MAPMEIRPPVLTLEDDIYILDIVVQKQLHFNYQQWGFL